MQIDNLNVSTLCAFNSNTNADGWASHRASFRCFGNALANEPGHFQIGGLISVSLHSQIYYKRKAISIEMVYVMLIIGTFYTSESLCIVKISMDVVPKLYN